KVPIVDKDGKISGIVGISRDITERQIAEEAVRSSESKYRALTENLEQCILLKDATCRIVAANKPYCQSVGLSEEDVIGKTSHDLYPKHLADKYFADDMRVLTEGLRIEQEEQNLGNGQMRTVRVMKSPVRDGQGRITGTLCIFWDVTEQRTLEAQLRQSQKME